MIGNLTTKHWAILGAMLVAVGTQLGGLEHGWKDAITPAFIGGLLIQCGTTVAAIFVGAPRDPERRDRAIDQRWP